jgi:hypothetical protein
MLRQLLAKISANGWPSMRSAVRIARTIQYTLRQEVLRHLHAKAVVGNDCLAIVRNRTSLTDHAQECGCKGSLFRSWGGSEGRKVVSALIRLAA